ncbi:MAG: hypothetical protein CVU63_07325, partial [Deltaproteobacteria bacterium HGW-Deltaproteobacteria-20]
YAGYLFGTVALSADTGTRLDTVALDLGVVGPPSLAEQTQKLVHEFIGDDPNGWSTQLGTEVAFRLVYEQSHKIGTRLGPELWGLEIDAIPQATEGLRTERRSPARRRARPPGRRPRTRRTRTGSRHRRNSRTAATASSAIRCAPARSRPGHPAALRTPRPQGRRPTWQVVRGRRPPCLRRRRRNRQRKGLGQGSGRWEGEGTCS